MAVSSQTARPRRSNASRTIALISLALLVLALFGQAGSAAKKGKTITLGESLNDAQRTELLDLFEAKGDDRVITVTTADTRAAMEGIFPPNSISSAFSSAALTCRDLGDGLDVTTRNITVVTPDLYAIALVTAGIGDATLFVAAPASAAAQGMTALAGVFKTWDLAPCESGNTTKERQRLALEQLAVASEIGLALTGAGIPDGIQRAGNIVLEAQKTIVTDKLTKRDAVAAAIQAQEQVQGVTIPPELREKLIDVMTRLAKQKIDWSTFSAGWTIERDAGNTRITMTGEGIAIRNARQTATAQAALDMTATAEADTSWLTATAEAAASTASAEAAAANATGTALAESASATAAANARATERAAVAMTATAAAQPTATPTPLPTATAAPALRSGTLVALRPGEIDVKLKGSGGTTLSVAPGAWITRDGAAAELAQLQVGDTVQLTVDETTRIATAVHAEPPATPLMERLAGFGWVLMGGGLVSALVVVKRRNREDPFVITLRIE